ncbi:flagellar biosynthesis anti-sigma factor FlgM [Delftia sp. PS-11]|uniref:flagellar biosynthesis anti-sigma factor FlgM n=1 Tax=Delftia sp. PS-11 TaxID=2767222 RepID=UPI002456CE1E|nr:flagellar biosynthesis anti-sigma factor FlgM [Delftia sp. PS-11]KAJ8746258.1 flagellar biosynthesis anti-sigma factor FlgM [Delftia sp. PS-11]
MKIGQKPELPAGGPQAVVNKQHTKTASAVATEESSQVAPAKAAGVPVSFSLSARALDQTGRASDDFDANRVKEIREAIANGTFRVNAEAVASKLLANSEEFLSYSRA